MYQKSRFPDVREQATGKWTGILQSLGVPDEFLKNKHGPCPFCGGKDRYRYDNKDGRGTYYCAQCGSGDGWSLLMNFRGWEFGPAAREVRQVLGLVGEDKIAAQKTEQEKREIVRAAFRETKRVSHGDPVDLYLTSRDLDEQEYPTSIRYHPSAFYAPGLSMPAMFAVMQDADGRGVNIQRTFLTPDGKKADVDPQRKLMPGTIPKGSAVRLGEVSEVMGISEGVETAMAACAMHGFPVWSAISSQLLREWVLPEGVKELVIFGDNDPLYGGQAAAYHLAHRLSVTHRDLSCSVMIPKNIGQDFADIHKGYSK